MSIVVHIYYTGEKDNAKSFVQEMVAKGIVADIRKEQGNEQYEYFFPMEDPHTVLLIDRWCDQSALDFHHASPMMKEITKLREKYNLHMRVERCHSDISVPVQDEQFIRK